MFYHSLGCGIGYGYLHRIPVHSTVPMETPEPQAPEDPSSPVTVTHGFTEVQNALSDEHWVTHSHDNRQPGIITSQSMSNSRDHIVASNF